MAHADFFYAVTTENTKSAAADKSSKERKYPSSGFAFLSPLQLMRHKV
jgi:hypothetical protein